jgi:hypothetical protein
MIARATVAPATEPPSTKGRVRCRGESEAGQRLPSQASKVDIGHFDNSNWYNRPGRARRLVPGNPESLRGRSWTVGQHCDNGVDGEAPRKRSLLLT